MKIYLDSIGCRLNQAEIEKYAGQFHAAGHQIVASPGEADLTVINTCAVTSEAASDSRQKIRQAARAGCKWIIPTGCLSALEAEELLKLPGVGKVVLNTDKDHLVRSVLGMESGEERISLRQRVQGARGRTRAFIKAQDGCDQHCTYCITRFARGKSRSVPAEDVVADIRAAETSGVKEAVLSGVQLGSWGRDLLPKKDIAWLMRRILEETTIPRLRFSSIEPWNLPDDLYSLWENPRVCPQLHLPLQSGSAATLKRMGRLNTPGSYFEIVRRMRTQVPNIALTTDIIVGFPGETDAEFEESLQFVKMVQFAGGHVFAYSEREGTPAVQLEGKVDSMEKKLRSKKMRLVLEKAGLSFQGRLLGQTTEVLWESAISDGEDGWVLSGLTGNYVRVRANCGQPLENEISLVELRSVQNDGMYGKIV